MAEAVVLLRVVRVSHIQSGLLIQLVVAVSICNNKMHSIGFIDNKTTESPAAVAALVVQRIELLAGNSITVDCQSPRRHRQEGADHAENQQHGQGPS